MTVRTFGGKSVEKNQMRPGPSPVTPWHRLPSAPAPAAAACYCTDCENGLPKDLVRRVRHGHRKSASFVTLLLVG